MQRVQQDGRIWYRFEQWPNLRHGIFTRQGGVSPAPWASLNMGSTVGDDLAHVRRNHELMFESLQLDPVRVATVWQVHSAAVVLANAALPARRWLAQADGLVTDRLDLALTMRFADCTPIMFLDARRGVIGVAHAGWRGTVQGVAARTVETMHKAYGCQLHDIQAGIGPCIGPRRYQVGEEVVAAVQAYFGTTAGLIRREAADNSAYLDLWAANRLDLQRAGVEQIEVAELCTAEHCDEFFSHRADKGRTGRFGMAVALS